MRRRLEAARRVGSAKLSRRGGAGLLEWRGEVMTTTFCGSAERNKTSGTEKIETLAERKSRENGRRQ